MNTAIPLKKIRFMKLFKLPVVNVESGEAEYEILREVNGYLLVPNAEAEKFTGYSSQKIAELQKQGDLKRLNANGTIRKEKKAGGSKLYFDLYQWREL